MATRSLPLENVKSARLNYANEPHVIESAATATTTTTAATTAALLNTANSIEPMMQNLNKRWHVNAYYYYC